MGLRRDGVHTLTKAQSVGSLVDLQDIDDEPLDPSPPRDPSPIDSLEEKEQPVTVAEDDAAALTHRLAAAAVPGATAGPAVAGPAVAGPAVAGPTAYKLEYAAGECCLCRMTLTSNSATFFGGDRTFCSNECRTRCLVAWEAAKGASSSKAPPSLDRCLAMYWAANGLV